MRITFLNPDLNLSGGQRVVAIYSERLRRRGHDVTVVATPRARPSWPSRLKGMLRGRGWARAEDRKPSHLEMASVELRVIDRVRPIADADVPDADVVVATWWETAEWVSALSPRKGAKAYFLQHHEVHDWLPVERVERTWRMPMQKITCAEWLKDLAALRYGDPSAICVPNSVDGEQFHAPPRGKQAVPTVGLLYSTTTFKGCDVSLAAFSTVARRMPGARLVAFGVGSPASSLPLPSGTHFVGDPRQDQLRSLYAMCDVWMCGSRSEGFHLPPLEAMACRCPVVSTRVGGPVDTIQDGVNGYLVDIDDAEALAGRVVDVLSLTEPMWVSMSEAAHATASRYTWDDATDKFEAALRRCLQTRP